MQATVLSSNTDATKNAVNEDRRLPDSATTAPDTRVSPARFSSAQENAHYKRTPPTLKYPGTLEQPHTPNKVAAAVRHKGFSARSRL